MAATMVGSPRKKGLFGTQSVPFKPEDKHFELPRYLHVLGVTWLN